jgi:hypothetical protein
LFFFPSQANHIGRRSLFLPLAACAFVFLSLPSKSQLPPEFVVAINRRCFCFSFPR